MDYACVVVKTPKGLFKPVIAEIIDMYASDGDSWLRVVAEGPPCEVVEEAIRYINKKAPWKARKFLNPLRPMIPGTLWLSECGEETV